MRMVTPWGAERSPVSPQHTGTRTSALAASPADGGQGLWLSVSAAHGALGSHKTQMQVTLRPGLSPPGTSTGHTRAHMCQDTGPQKSQCADHRQKEPG